MGLTGCVVVKYEKEGSGFGRISVDEVDDFLMAESWALSWKSYGPGSCIRGADKSGGT